MKKILFIFVLAVASCSAEDQGGCGHVNEKEIVYNNKNGMYIFKIFVDGKEVVVTEAKYKTISKGDYYCE